MILGVYWAFKFPEKIYSFDYFKYQGTQGGFAHAPSEIFMNCQVDNSDDIIEKLKHLIDNYPDGLLFIYKKGKSINISTGSYTLFDFDFLLIQKVEELLKKETISNINSSDTKGGELIRIIGNRRNEFDLLPKKEIFQIVGSEFSKHNSETSAIRFDCNVLKSDKSDFLKELEIISLEENISVIYYLEKESTNRINLMVFFTNGRQGLGLEPLIHVDGARFENKVKNLTNKFSLTFGFEKGYYPESDEKFIRIIDKEFIIR